MFAVLMMVTFIPAISLWLPSVVIKYHLITRVP